MKSPTWEPTVGNLLSFLNSNTALFMVDLYTIYAANGSAVAYLTSGEIPLTVNGYTYQAGAKIDRSKISSKVGIELSTLQVDIYADPTILIGGVPFVQALVYGFLDYGRIHVERLFMNSAFAMQGTVLLFEGAVGQIVTNRGHAQIEVVSDTQLLDILIPSAVYQPSCRNSFCDLNCTLATSTWTQSGSVYASSDPTNQTFTANFTGTPAAATGYLSLGIANWITGANAGISKTIKAHTGTGYGLIQMTTGLLSPIAIGDTFTVTAGCDKTMATCTAKFSNVVNFAAEPFIPLPQTVT